MTLKDLQSNSFYHSANVYIILKEYQDFIFKSFEIQDPFFALI